MYADSLKGGGRGGGVWVGGDRPGLEISNTYTNYIL